jgi:flagellar hook assembly protein FlgD
MGYDYRTAGSSVAGSIAPLAGPVYDLTETVLAYLDEVPASKIILGVPWYGRAWSTVSDELNAKTQSGPKYGHSAAVPYAQALEAATARDVRWDGREATSWFAYQRSNCTQAYGCVTSWRQVYFDGDRAMRLKYDLVNRYGIRGVGIWALGYEGSRREPWNGLADKFLRDTTPPEAGIVALPQDVPDEGFVVDWSARDDYNGVVGYDVQASVDGGSWTPWLTGTKAGADVWLGQDGHGYAFRVRAKDGKGNLGAWETVTTFVADPALAVGGFARVLVDGLTARSKPDTGARQRETLNAGDRVWITDGPVSADGYTWYQVIAPLVEWNPVSPVRRAWVAESDGGSSFLAPVRPPNSTRVVAGISGLSFGAVGAASVGPTPTAASRRAFSPNGDGSQDSIRLDWRARVAFDALTLNVFRPDGTLVGSRAVPARAAGDQSFSWDGRVGDAGLTDGTYLLQLVGTDGGATYAAPSERPVTPSQLASYAVTIDTVAPTAGTATISGRRISPNGDGRLDALTIEGSATGANRWSFTVAPVVAGVAGAVVQAIGGAGATTTVNWDGTTDTGAVVPDGVYRVSIRTLDWAGNGPGASWDVVVDSRAPAVTLGPLSPSISPNGDGSGDRAAISWTSDEPVRGEIRIVHGSTLVRRWKQSSGATGSIAWDGTEARGKAAADGRYVVEAELTDASGNRVVERAGVTVDRTVGKLRWDPTAFLPDADSLAEAADLSFRLTRTATTSLRIEDSAGRVVRNAWKDRARDAGTVTWTWDGRDGHRDLVAPGRYVAVLSVVSKLGASELRRTTLVDAFLAMLSTKDPAAGDTLTLTIRSVEPLRSMPTVTLIQTGLTPVKVKATKTGPGIYAATLAVATGPGPATIVIAARDAGGGTDLTRLAVTVK